MEITLYALGNYNAGRLVAKTFYPAEYLDRAEYLTDVSDWLNTVPYPYEPDRFEEEWIVADYENIPSEFVDEYDLSRSFWSYHEAVQNIDSDLHEAFQVFYQNFESGGVIPDFNEAYIGSFEDEVEFVEHWFIEIEGMKDFPPVNMCIDYQRTYELIQANNGIIESSGFYFWNH